MLSTLMAESSSLNVRRSWSSVESTEMKVMLVKQKLTNLTLNSPWPEKGYREVYRLEYLPKSFL